MTRPIFEYGFWWWYDATRRDWRIGYAPYYGPPSWASPAPAGSKR